jgi:hypothetical protein
MARRNEDDMLKTVQIFKLQGEYAPYDRMPEFQEGAEAYRNCRTLCRYSGVQAQAWDRGAEYAMRAARIVAEG